MNFEAESPNNYLIQHLVTQFRCFRELTNLHSSQTKIIMSQIILKESFRHFIILGAAVILATIFSCYAIAVLLGHVPVWLPMISDCGVHAPEKYFFSYGLVTGSVLICAESLLLYHAEGKTFSHSRLCLITSFMAAVGMGVVGVVNEKENIN